MKCALPLLCAALTATSLAAAATHAAPPPRKQSRIVVYWTGKKAGDLFVDGKKAGTVSDDQVGIGKPYPSVTTTVAPGRHNLELRRANKKPKQREFDVAAGQTLVVEINNLGILYGVSRFRTTDIKPGKARVEVVSPNGSCTARIDDTVDFGLPMAGAAAERADKEIDAGLHLIKTRCKGQFYGSQIRAFRVRPGVTARFVIEPWRLERPGTPGAVLVVKATEKTMTLQVDDLMKGMLPTAKHAKMDARFQIPPGKHVLTLTGLQKLGDYPIKLGKRERVVIELGANGKPKELSRGPLPAVKGK